MPEQSPASALDTARAIASGRTTAQAGIETCLARIAAREDHVGAWIHVDSERALTEARTRDAEPPRSPLHGIPVGVKDVIDTADMPTGYGSSIYAGYRPGADAACVALLRAAGMIVLGKTVTTEFAYRFPGRTRNPLNLFHTPGGSSSGSAAAVADGMTPLAIGTQTAGSVIRPASYCGVVGYKPTYGRINRAGLKFLAESLDTIGVFAANVGDAAAFAAVLSGVPVEAMETIGAAPRVGICRTPWWESAEAATQAALEAAAERVAIAGARTCGVDLPTPYADAHAAQQVIQTREAWCALAYEREAHGDRLSDAIKAQLRIGGECPPERYAAALQTTARCRAASEDLFGEHDVLLAPSAPGEAPADPATTGDPVFNRLWTVLRAPCITLPAFTGPLGLPVGVQVIGKPGADAFTLACAKWIHGAL